MVVGMTITAAEIMTADSNPDQLGSRRESNERWKRD